MLTNLTRRELIANMEVCAERLTGIPVTVRIIPHARVNGLIQKDLHGRAVMDLHPAIFEDVKQFAEVFTHEAAHIVRHFGSMPRRDVEKGIANEVSKQAYHLESNTRGNPIARTVQKHEAEADETAAGWMAIVKSHYGGYEASTHDPILAVLKILYHKVTK